MVKVSVPNKNYAGKVAGVCFYQGEGLFEDKTLAKNICDDLGYELVVEEPKQQQPSQAKKKPKK